MARNIGSGTKGISPKDAKVNPVKKKEEPPIMGFNDVAGTPGEPVITEEVKQETPSIKKEEPKTDKKEETKIESEQEENKQEEVKEEVPVVEEGKQEEKQQDEEPQNGGNSDEEEEEMKEKTEEMDALDSLLKGEKSVPKKLTKSYFIEKEVADKIDKLGKKIPKSMGGTGAFVNELLKKALIDKGLW